MHFCAGRRRLLSSTAAAGLGLISASLGLPTAIAQTSSSPIDLIVPGGPGAGTDLVARVAAKGLSEQLGRAVIVKNVPGAGGTIAAQMGARAKPDGNTLFFAITGTHTVNQFLFDKLPYNPKNDFVPISLVCKYNNVLVVRPEFPARKIDDLIAFIRSNPGKFFYGITFNGSSSHLAMELLKTEAHLDLPGVAYKGGAAAVADFLGGQYPVLMDTVINQLQHIRAGKVVAVATTGAKRSPVLPEIPTLVESGYPTVEAIGWAGVMAPAGTPAPLIAQFNQAIKAVIASNAFDGLNSSGLETQYTTPEEMSAFIERESARWGRLVKSANIKPS
jgi:tripartite-type tricarboxylate transporter receptor subunit TctC